jgi:DNA-binding NtrC family response regulator
VSAAAPPAPARLASDRPEVRAGIRVLLVEDEATLRQSCATVLAAEGYRVTACARGAEARQHLQRQPFDVALLDHYLGDLTGMELLPDCLDANPDMLVILMTGKPSVGSSVEAVRAGAWDYLPKPFSATHAQILFGRACFEVVARRARREQEAGAAPAPGPRAGERRRDPGVEAALLGRSPAFLHVVQLARKVALTDAPVLITGESGTGKEVIAQFIHRHSRRAEHPLVAVNCAALPETLLESELFGHAKGAFTGAIRDKPGLLEIASAGTFFLDELTEMSLPIQAKLLRVIQDGVLRRVGSETTNAVTEVRFIAATNRDPRQATAEGALRKDLFYRLSVFPLRIPPLRERREDVPLLAEHFLATYWERHREPGSPVPRLTPAAVSALQKREWTGNVRELQNVIEHAVILLQPGADVHPDDLPGGDDAEAPVSGAAFGAWAEAAEGGYHETRERTMAQFELNYLRWLIEHAGANMSRAAKIAGVDRTTLYRLMEKHGLQRSTTIRPA